MTAFLAAAWAIRYPIAAAVAAVYAASAIVLWHAARNAPLVDDYGPRVMHGPLDDPRHQENS